jgi:hypothetical protein
LRAGGLWKRTTGGEFGGAAEAANTTTKNRHANLTIMFAIFIGPLVYNGRSIY